MRPGVGVATGVDARHPDAAVGRHAGQAWIASDTDRNAVAAMCPGDDPRYRVQLPAPLSSPQEIAEGGKADLLDPDRAGVEVGDKPLDLHSLAELGGSP